ncbi:AraC family transcriptional regulator [Hufsiella ginkgonis]|uniref:Helix-turn-helix domain-containing protein n=1 Tax=Hufsiella ginkgonis TaxID=2695274 RepID=A0A7K1XVS9_9SPHI|nr:helix-turn-helix domain-containing protein [Hufsiella ginkgonis]MXV14927.1 helix-turn-helix domain-containing protein [Hufsiella ginkgonis]
MKPQLLKISPGPAQSFSVRQDLMPINNRWHYHPEVELIHIKEGDGTRFVGDNISVFHPDDLLMIGTQLPHYFRFDDAYYKTDSGTRADVRVSHFTENFWGDHFLNLPENKPIKTVLEKSRYGLLITGDTKRQVVELLDKMLHSEGPERVLNLIRILIAVSKGNDVSTISSIGFKNKFEESEKERINEIYEYSMANFKRKIQLEEIAAIAGISPNSFCRYFKLRTRKTYSQFLIEIKVGHACRLLIDNRLSIKQLCYESGFNNFASFHKYFKIITGKSPLNYQREFINGRN